MGQMGNSSKCLWDNKEKQGYRIHLECRWFKIGGRKPGPSATTDVIKAVALPDELLINGAWNQVRLSLCLVAACMGTSCLTRKQFNAASKHIHTAWLCKIQMHKISILLFKKKELVTPIIECGHKDNFISMFMTNEGRILPEVLWWMHLPCRPHC